MRIGLVSDTHGRFDPMLNQLFSGCEVILHAGDVCGEEVLRALERIAPVLAVRGNCDESYSTNRLPEWRVEELAKARILIIHDVGRPDRVAPKVRSLIDKQQPRVVMAGHSHSAYVVEKDGIIYVNPGSSGQKRFHLIRSAGMLVVRDGQIEASLYSLERQAPELMRSTIFPLA